ncbi:adenylate/guanylate cyclase domain-containing protein [Marmoricola sp. RAF53]
MAQDDLAGFCFACGGRLAEDPACASCGSALPAGARFCPYCGNSHGAAGAATPAAAAAQPVRPGAARKITSVLFGDLVGFTTLSESRDAEEVRELLTEYFDECRAVISRYGGELEKFIGDAVMAVWGIPVTREDDAERAVRAGLELVGRVSALGDRIGMHGLALRVGITTAEVAVTLGATGQGMVAGDPVNTAARIQSTAAPGEVWVDETTRAFSASSISYADAGSHAMKGKAEPVPLWKVRAVVAGVGGDRRDDGLEAPLVGRDGELRLVKEFFHRVQETLRPGLLVVDGEAGVGKTRLGWEFEKYVDGFQARVLWHRGRCLSYGEGVAYYALAEAVRGRLAVLAGAVVAVGEAAADNRQLLERGLAACVPVETERAWLEPRLAVLLGLDAGSSFPREDLFAAWTAFFKYVGLWNADEPQPVVLVIDDAQYADDGLLAFLEHLLAAADFPVFVLALARPELLADHPALVSNRRLTAVHLEPLTSVEMVRLLDAMIVGVPETIRDELVARSEGIPLYAIETVRALADLDLVQARDGHYVLADPDAVDLGALTAPASLQALIAARLDTLPADERKVVDRASVLGIAFSADGLAALCADVPDLELAISGLVRREVIRRDTDRLSADYGDYRFVQGVVRQVAYGMLSRRDRKATHLTVARTLEAELDARNDAYELAPIIAQHYLDALDAVPADADVADLTRAASDHLERAADRAASLGAPREAAAHLAQALARSAAERRLTIQSKLSRQLRLAGDHDGAIEHATQALKGFEANGDVLAAAGPAEDLARAIVYGESADYDRARSVIADLLERIPDQPGTRHARVDLLNTAFSVALVSGDAESCSRLAWESLAIAELIGDPRLIAVTLGAVAIAITNRLPYTASLIFEHTAELAGENRALRARSLALLNAADLFCFQDIAAAIRNAREAVAASTELGEPDVLTYAQLNLCLALQLAGEWDEAVEIAGLEDLLRFTSVTGDVRLRALTLARGEEMAPIEELFGQDPAAVDDPPSRAYYTLGRALDAAVAGLPEATSLALESVRLSHAAYATLGDFWPFLVFASDIVLEQGEVGMLADLLPFVDLATGPVPTGVAAQRARLEAVLGEHRSVAADQIEQNFTEALAGMRTWGSALYEAHTCVDYGRWLERQGRRDEAAPLLARAREVYEGIGARHWLAALDQPSAG